MPNLNKVQLMGNITRDIDDRSNDRNSIASFGLAINRKWRNQAGEQQEETTFVDCTAFGKTAELIVQHVRKGDPIYIDGRLKLDQWQDRDGNNRSKLGIVVEGMQFLSSNGGNRNNNTRNAPPANNNQGGSYAGARTPHDQPVDEDDIPF